MELCLCLRTCPVVTTVVSMARAVRKAFKESYVDRCGPLGVKLCTKYRLTLSLLSSSWTSFIVLFKFLKNCGISKCKKLCLLGVCVSRINQARVYLQAYRVGYKIQCPQRVGRWTWNRQTTEKIKKWSETKKRGPVTGKLEESQTVQGWCGPSENCFTRESLLLKWKVDLYHKRCLCSLWLVYYTIMQVTFNDNKVCYVHVWKLNVVCLFYQMASVLFS